MIIFSRAKSELKPLALAISVGSKRTFSLLLPLFCLQLYKGFKNGQSLIIFIGTHYAYIFDMFGYATTMRFQFRNLLYKIISH
jgi:hypothetical protein